MRQNLDDFTTSMMQDNVFSQKESDSGTTIKDIGKVVETEIKKAFEKAAKNDPLMVQNGASGADPVQDGADDADDVTVDNNVDNVDNEEKEN